jgi:hypothetical protein
MKSMFKICTTVGALIAATGLAACADTGSNPSAASYQQDRPVTGSNLVHHTTTGTSSVDASGVTTYAPGASGAPGGNGLPSARP